MGSYSALVSLMTLSSPSGGRVADAVFGGSGTMPVLATAAATGIRG